MKRPVKRFGMEHEADVTPYAYVNARWRQSTGEWDRVLVTEPWPREPAMDVLLGVAPALSSLLAMIGASGLALLIAPLRAPPSYWLDRCAGGGSANAVVHGCRPCGADVVIIDVLGVRACDWSSALDAQIIPFALRLHAEMAAVFTTSGVK